MYDDIDLEELECRLYSQVYHSNSNTENDEVGLPADIAVNANGKAQNNRYFSKGYISNERNFIPLEENITGSDNNRSSIHNSVSFTPSSTDITSEGNFGNQFQNNITVNQFTVPFILSPDLTELFDPNYRDASLFVPWNVRNQKLLEKRNRKQQKRLEKRRQKNKEKRDQIIESNKTRKRPENVQRNHIIFISDESDSECLYIGEMQKKAEKSNENHDPSSTLEHAESESDDDIVYIPPPPIEIINVDVDVEDSTNNQLDIEENVSSTVNDTPVLLNKSNSQPPVSEISDAPVEASTSNDFLENSTIENAVNKFNFSLHGSDFQNTSDFVRPADPVEYCETESSCSTNDLNKENSSVKTVVFSEVDFPREDIFSDKNLEGFSTYITPKRNKFPKKVSSNSQENPDKTNEIDSSSSSSESDYEPVEDACCNKKLPTLSPMNYNKTPIKQSSKKKVKSSTSKEASITGKESGKRKSNTLSNTESDGNEKSESVSVNLQKKKKKSNAKKNAPAEVNNQSAEMQICDVANERNTNILESDTCKPLRKRKNKKNSTDKILNLESDHENSSSSNVTNKKNNEDVEHISRKKKKKNYKKSEECNTSLLDSGEISPDRMRRKKKKSISSDNAVNISEIDELNQSWVGISDIDNFNLEDENNVNDNCSNVNNADAISLNELHDESPEVEYVSNCQLEDNEGNHSKSPTNISNMVNESNDELIVIDEIESDHSVQDRVEILSSDSEYDHNVLGDVGQDLELANCTGNANVVINVVPTKNIGNSTRPTIDYSNFDVQQIQSTQTDDPEAWKILAKDQFPYYNAEFKRGPRCNRCRRFGHIGIRCPDKPNPPRCTLCASSGHQEPRCPNKRCNQCGNEGDYSTVYCRKCIKFRHSICRICNMTGHIAKKCPDLWRRYHVTTKAGPIVIPEEKHLKPRNLLWCSGCAGQGHLEHECNYYNREYPPTNPGVISYEDVLNPDKNRESATPTPPPPPTISNRREFNNFHRNVSSFSNFPSTSQNASYNAPFFISPLIPPLIPPLMAPLMAPLTNLNPMLPIPQMLGQNRMIIQDGNMSRQNETLPTNQHGADILGRNEAAVCRNVNLGPRFSGNLGQRSTRWRYDDVNCNSSSSSSATKVLNPFSVLANQVHGTSKIQNLEQMMLNYVNEGDNKNSTNGGNANGKLIHPHRVKHSINEFLKKDERKIKRIIMSMPSHMVKQFLRKELDELENVVSTSDPKHLRKKLCKYDNILKSKKLLKCEIAKEKCFWFRILNMFIFGVHKFRDGKIHMNYIKSYLSEPQQSKLDTHKRKSLFNAYFYIFNAERHPNLNYFKIINMLINRSNEEVVSQN